MSARVKDAGAPGTVVAILMVAASTSPAFSAEHWRRPTAHCLNIASEVLASVAKCFLAKGDAASSQRVNALLGIGFGEFKGCPPTEME